MAKAYNNYSDIIDFTRASSGTALRPVSYGDELVTNGTFDTDSDWINGTGWSISGGQLVATSALTYSTALQGLSTIAGKVYEASVELTSKTSGAFRFYIHDGTSYKEYVELTSVGTYKIIWTAHTNADAVRVYCYSSSNPNTASFDNVSVREVIFDQTGAPLTLFNHPTNIPRIEYDADGNRLGLLVEEQRTNLVPYSEDFSNSAWSKYYSLSVSESSEISPDKNQNAYEVSGIESTDGDIGLTDVVSITPSTTYSLSIWVKAANQSDIGKYIKLRSKRNGGAFVAEDNIIQLSNEWVRHSLTITFLADNNGASFTITRSSDTPLAERSDSCLIYGAQLEAGSFPTSYIPTSGAAATRSADVASVDVTDFGYNEGDGSLLVECNVLGIKPNTTHGVAALYNSTNNRHYMYFYNTLVGGVTLDEGGSQANIYGKSDYLADDFVKTSYSYKKDSFVSAVDGETPATDSAGTLPENLNYLYIGRSDTSQYLNGHIKSIKYYPRAVTAAQLQELTS